MAPSFVIKSDNHHFKDFYLSDNEPYKAWYLRALVVAQAVASRTTDQESESSNVHLELGLNTSITLSFSYFSNHERFIQDMAFWDGKVDKPI